MFNSTFKNSKIVYSANASAVHAIRLRTDALMIKKGLWQFLTCTKNLNTLRKKRNPYDFLRIFKYKYPKKKLLDTKKKIIKLQ